MQLRRDLGDPLVALDPGHTFLRPAARDGLIHLFALPHRRVQHIDAREPRTHAYVERRITEGMSSKEIHRCLKRYLVRELYRVILSDLQVDGLTT